MMKKISLIALLLTVMSFANADDKAPDEKKADEATVAVPEEEKVAPTDDANKEKNAEEEISKEKNSEESK
ncbi:MAG: hypothetical protein LBU35_03375 [Holosporales bacterium]|jgi:hypothetical protein|nr:hypothetical protein [Holosporales bacterium]